MKTITESYYLPRTDDAARFPQDAVCLSPKQDDGTTVYFFPAGGGFQRSMFHCDFMDAYRPVTAVDVDASRIQRPSLFGFDDGPVYLGWSNGSHWNGWACPNLPHAEMRAWLAYMAGVDGEDGYKSTETVEGFTMTDMSYPDEPYQLNVNTSICHDGEMRNLYPAGDGFCWMDWADMFAQDAATQTGGLISEFETLMPDHSDGVHLYGPDDDRVAFLRADNKERTLICVSRDGDATFLTCIVGNVELRVNADDAGGDFWRDVADLATGDWKRPE